MCHTVVQDYHGEHMTYECITPTEIETGTEFDPTSLEEHEMAELLGTVVVMQVCPDGVTPCAAPPYCARPENSCYNGIYMR
jgi:hypothetical protein